MSITSRQIGDGITVETRKTQRLDTMSNDEKQDAFQGLVDSTTRINSFWGTKARLIEWLRDRLAVLQDAAPEIEDWQANAAAYAPRKTKLWYVLRAVQHANAVERCIAEGRPWAAVSLAFDIGEYVTELGFKMDHEKEALAGRQIIEARGLSAEKNRRDSEEKRYLTAKSYIDEGKTVARDFHLTAQDLGNCKSSSVKRDYYAVKNRSKPDRLER